MAYAFESICNYVPAVVPYDAEDVVLLEDINIVDTDTLNNTEWCTCRNCTTMPTETESDPPKLSCIIEHRLFPMLCEEKYLLEVVMLSLKDVRLGQYRISLADMCIIGLVYCFVYYFVYLGGLVYYMLADLI